MGPAKKAVQGRGVIDEVANRVQRAWGESPFYQVQLGGPAPDRLHFQPHDARTPDRTLGESLMQGRISFGADAIDSEGDPAKLWELAPATSSIGAFLHQFAWLGSCAALGEGAAEPARRLISGWLERYEKWSPEAWEPYLTAERLTELCCHSAFALKGADALWRSRLLSSMARQARHLAKVSHRAGTGYERLMTALGLVLAALCMPGCDEPAEKGIELLRRELRLQVRPDGGHVSRNPSRQLSLVLRLQMVLRAIEARRLETPAFLRHTLGRAVGNLQFFRAGDGELVVFNGGYQDDSRALLSALQSLDPENAPTGFARHTGFQRLDAARALVILDVGCAVAPREFESASSFHFSSGRARIVGNCGAGAHVSGDWAKALKQAAAHSTLSAETPAGAAVLALPLPGECRRAEDGRGQLVEIERRFGETEDAPRHIRRLYLAAGGDSLKGEDRLIAPTAALSGAFRLRFHLHPSVKASLARDGKSVILALSNREGWRFRTNFRALRLEKSIYSGDGGLPAASEQIVLGAFDLEPAEPGDIVVKWAFQKLDGAGLERR